MDSEPAPDPGRDQDPGPDEDDSASPASPGGPGGAAELAAGVTPDWLDDAGWEHACGRYDDDDDGPGDEDAEWYADPDYGPPPELAGVPIAVIFAQAQAGGAEEAAITRQMIEVGACPAGYAHIPGASPVTGPCDGPAAGFALGMPFDALPPGTTLAGLADEASGQDRAFAEVNDDQLMGLIGARQRLGSRQAWELLMTVAEFIRRRPAPGCKLELPGRMPQVWNEHSASELAAQLRLTGHAAGVLLWLAHDLTVKLPATSAALRDGVIDLNKAHIIALRCWALTPAEARAAEAILFARAEVGEMTEGMVRDRIARAVIEVNPEAAARRREAAAKERRVEVWTENSGNAGLAGRELPPAAVLAASQMLTARARQLRAAGVEGGLDELRVLAYLEKLGVLNPLDPTPADDGPGDDSNGRPDTEAGPDGGPGGGGGGRGPSGSRPGSPGGAGLVPGAVPVGFAGRVTLTVPLTTLQRLAERPGVMPRIGAVDPALARDLAAAAARNPASTWCLTVTGPDGRPVAHGCGRPAPRDQPERGKQDRPGLQARDGPIYTPGDAGAPPGSGTVRLNPAALTKTAGEADAAGKELVFALEPLAGPCDHRHEAAGHDPGAMLRHLTGVLNGTCTFPPCRRPESQSDYEHSLPYDQGGRTCLCQAGPVCRHNHRDKQAPGWRLEEAGSRGWFRWTTPSGRSYLSRPTQYPD